MGQCETGKEDFIQGCYDSLWETTIMSELISTVTELG